MSGCAAYTALGSNYPPYANAKLDGDDVVLTIREEATYVPHGAYVCSHKPGPGNCTPGGPTCNNYCNMAPDKGPMQDHPLPNSYYHCGETKQMRMPRADFAKFIADAQEMLK